MSFRDKLKIEIESIFDSTGFNRFKASIAEAKALTESFGSEVNNAFDRGQQLRGFRRKMSKVSEAFEGVLENTDISLTPESVNAPLFDSEKDFMGFDDPRFVEAMANQMERISNSSKDIPDKPFSNVQGDQIPAVMGGADTKPGVGADLSRATENIPTPDEAFANMQGDQIPVDFRKAYERAIPRKGDVGRFENFKPAGMERLGNVFRNVNIAELGVLTSNMQEYGKTVNVATSGTQRFRNRALKGLDSTFQKAASGVRSLQMRLLGLQFTMMTIAFIFAGLMSSALGAVGIFEILGNTLKFLFLPTALDLLDPMLAFQDAVFGLSEEMRRTIGRFVGMAAAASLVVTIAAILGKAFLSIISPLFTLLGGATSLIQGFYGITTAASGLKGVAQAIGGPLGTIVTFFSSGGSTASGFAGTLSTLSGSFSTLMGIVSKLALPLFILFSVITGLVAIFNRFPGVVNAVRSAFKQIFNTVVRNLTFLFNIVSAVFGGITNIITGLTTLAVAVVTQQWGKAVDGLKEILFGLAQFLIKPFVLFINFLIENMNKVARIAKEPFIELVNFLATHVVSKIEDFATFLPETIIDGILELAGGLESALKDVLPGWLFDMVSDKLDFAGDITKTVDDFISQDFSANMKGFADDLANTENFKLFDKVKMPQIGQDFKPEETKSGGKSEEKKQQNNNTFNIEAVMQGNNESPQEMGERLGQGMADGFNNRQSNINNGT